MATTQTVKLGIETREYFDHRAPGWDEQPGISPEGIDCLQGVIQQLLPHRGDIVVDIGCGPGVLVPLLIPRVGRAGKIIAIDLSSRMLLCASRRVLHRRLHFAQADASALPLASASVDLAICNNAFPHLSNKSKALGEIARVVKPGGRIAICHTASRQTINNLHRSIGPPLQTIFSQANLNSYDS